MTHLKPSSNVTSLSFTDALRQKPQMSLCSPMYFKKLHHIISWPFCTLFSHLIDHWPFEVKDHTFFPVGLCPSVLVPPFTSFSMVTRPVHGTSTAHLDTEPVFQGIPFFHSCDSSYPLSTFSGIGTIWNCRSELPFSLCSSTKIGLCLCVWYHLSKLCPPHPWNSLLSNPSWITF